MQFSKDTDLTKNLILLNFSLKGISKKNLLYIIYFSISGILIFQIMFLFILFNSIPLKNIILYSLLLFLFEFSYLILIYSVIKIFINNDLIGKMFIQSSFLNVGVVFTLAIASPFIVYSFLFDFEIFLYYIYLLITVTILAFFYIRSLNIRNIIDRSINFYAKTMVFQDTANNRNPGNYHSASKNASIIFFAPNTVPYVFKRMPILIYLPYISAFFLAFYAFVARNWDSNSLYFLILSILILSALLLYSEICYFLLWIKYLIQNK